MSYLNILYFVRTYKKLFEGTYIKEVNDLLMLVEVII